MSPSVVALVEVDIIGRALEIVPKSWERCGTEFFSKLDETWAHALVTEIVEPPEEKLLLDKLGRKEGAVWMVDRPNSETAGFPNDSKSFAIHLYRF